MKATFFALFTFLSLFLGALAAPAQVEKRADPTALVESLYATVQQYTGIINQTTAALNADSTAADNTTAGETITSALASINSAVVDTTAQVNALGGSSKRSILARQDVGSLATLVEDLLLDISGALNNVIATLGLTSTLSFLGPLVSSLSGLLLSLESVVNNLLAVVEQLLDGLLTGLSVGLAGLTL